MNVATFVSIGRRSFLVFLALLSTSLLALDFMFPSVVLAANTATWVNSATISYQNVLYKEDDATDSNWHFYANNPSNGCKQEIKDLSNPGYNSNKGPFKEQNIKLYKQKAVPGGGCSPDGTDTIRLLAQPPGYNVAFVWQDNKNIVSADGKKAFFQFDDGTFKSTKDGDCADYITVGGDKSNISLHVRSNHGNEDATNSLKSKYNGNSTGSGWPFVRDIKSKGGDPVKINGTSCNESNPVPVQADSTNSGVQGTAAGSTGVGKDGPPTCETTGNNPLSWVLCPLINGIANFSDWALNSIIVPFLENVPISTDSSSPSFTAWSSFRILGDIVLVGMLVVIAVAQGRSS